MNSKRTLVSWFAVGVSTIALGHTAFSNEEISALRKYWSAKDRYTVEKPREWEKRGLFQVRLTPEGSEFLWKLARFRGVKKPVPGQLPPAPNAEQAPWDVWIEAKYALDAANAQIQAAESNRKAIPDFAGPVFVAPIDPGPAPQGLVDALGEPPTFVNVVEPKLHRTRFDRDFVVELQDNPDMRPMYAYYRFRDGVMHGGESVRRLPQDEVLKLFLDAGLTDVEQRVMAAVSMLEGGFESINTYDTGFVSVGLIQFASLREGGGSLGRLLQRYKNANPRAFQRDFRQFGLDVCPNAKLCVLDSESGRCASGPDANQILIRDKRLVSVFYRAGKLSREFRIAQIQSAKQDYYPGAEPVTISIGGTTIQCKVADIIKSEAGLATLMDRKVNTGSLDPLSLVLVSIASAKQVQTAEQLAAFEPEIVAAMRYRKDYLKDPTLSQPLKRR